jgi:5-formyltetrahydrofolate cyclo-ligase
MSADAAAAKAALRERLRGELKRLPAEQRVRDSASICRLVQAQPAWTGARTVLLFAPLPTEPDVWPLVEAALSSAKTVCVPRFEPGRGGYWPTVIRGAEDLRSGPHGVREPVGRCPALDAKQLDLALVPGLGFTLDGGRLGRGKGHFDRMLAGVNGRTCGVAFDCQLLAALPLEPHDIRLHCLVTPKRWHDFGGPARA